jgi:hypothetical protein
MRLKTWSYHPKWNIPLGFKWFSTIRVLWFTTKLFRLRIQDPQHLILWILLLLCLTGGFIK